MSRPDDIRPFAPSGPSADSLNALDWTPDKRAASLVVLYNYTVAQAKLATKWYDDKRGSKRFWAYVFRMTTLIATTLAGVIPTLAQMRAFQSSGQPLFDTLWSTVFVAVAGFALAADRFCGFTTGWVRYAQSSTRIGHDLNQFFVAWQAATAAAGVAAPAPSGGDLPPDAYVRERIEACRDFLSKVHQVVQAETDAWAAEFQKAVKAIDDTLEARRAEAPAPAPGAINITVSNGDQCKDGWTLAIDGGKPEPCTGTLVARNGLTPGAHRLHAQGVIAAQGAAADKPIAAEVAFEIESRKVTAVNLMLK